MSALEVIQQFKDLPPEERKQVARFVVEQDDSWISGALTEEMTAVESSAESEDVRDELLRRQEEYKAHPEKFSRMDQESLKAMFGRIADARSRISSAG